MQKTSFRESSSSSWVLKLLETNQKAKGWVLHKHKISSLAGGGPKIMPEQRDENLKEN